MDYNTTKYENNSDFQEFLRKEFDQTSVHATIEELAEFTFGNLQLAIQAFENALRKKDET